MEIEKIRKCSISTQEGNIQTAGIPESENKKKMETKKSSIT